MAVAGSLLIGVVSVSVGASGPPSSECMAFLQKLCSPSLGKRQDPMAVFSSLCLPILAEPRSSFLREDYVQEHATNEEIPSLVLIVL